MKLPIIFVIVASILSAANILVANAQIGGAIGGVVQQQQQQQNDDEFSSCMPTAVFFVQHSITESNNIIFCPTYQLFTNNGPDTPPGNE